MGGRRAPGLGVGALSSSPQRRRLTRPPPRWSALLSLDDGTACARRAWCVVALVVVVVPGGRTPAASGERVIKEAQARAGGRENGRGQGAQLAKDTRLQGVGNLRLANLTSFSEVTTTKPTAHPIIPVRRRRRRVESVRGRWRGSESGGLRTANCLACPSVVHTTRGGTHACGLNFCGFFTGCVARAGVEDFATLQGTGYG